MATPAPNAVMTFKSYTIEDEGTRMFFLCLNPGPSQPSDWDIFITDSELATVTNQSQLNTLVSTKLNRKFRGTGISPKLDPFIGQSITI